MTTPFVPALKNPFDPMDPTDPLSRWCGDMFASLARRDQRRWGETYVRGLLCLPGKKSIRQMADEIDGATDQGLQQFVNQSPWSWEPVRRRIGQVSSATARPRAWVVAEAVFAKSGDSSVGVARQYAPSMSRLLNCQLGLAVFVAGDDGDGTPVDWRLMLPQCWDDDGDRRAKTHLPAQERSRGRWRYALDMIDEMAGPWRLPPAPVVVDARHDTAVEPLLRGLEERGLLYVAQVAPGTALLPPAGVPRPAPAPARAGLSGLAGRIGPAADRRMVTAGELASAPGRRGGTTMFLGGGPDGSGPVSRFVVEPLDARPSARSAGRLRRPPRSLLTEWTPGRQRPAGIWVTNLGTSRLPETVGLTRLGHAMHGEVVRLHEDFGLGDFEGRSYRGWNHHVTLVSLAQAYAVGQQRDVRTRQDVGPSYA